MKLASSLSLFSCIKVSRNNFSTFHFTNQYLHHHHRSFLCMPSASSRPLLLFLLTCALLLLFLILQLVIIASSPSDDHNNNSSTQQQQLARMSLSPTPAALQLQQQQQQPSSSSCSGADFYSWTHPDASPPEFLTNRTAQLESLSQFAKYFATIPPELTSNNLRGGMQMEHAAAVWHTIRVTQPLVVIESGLWRGVTSRLIEHAAAPYGALLFFFDPLPEEQQRYHVTRDRNHQRVKYLEHKTFVDISRYAFSELTEKQRRRAVIVIDDHFGSLERIRTLADKFPNATVIWDDNYASSEDGSNFSPKQLLLSAECQWHWNKPSPLSEAKHQHQQPRELKKEKKDRKRMGMLPFRYQDDRVMIASDAMVERGERERHLKRRLISAAEIERRRKSYRELLDWYVELSPPYPQWPQSIHVERERERQQKEAASVERDYVWSQREAPALFASAELFWQWARQYGLNNDMPQTKWAGKLSNNICAFRIHDFDINAAELRPVQDCLHCKPKGGGT